MKHALPNKPLQPTSRVEGLGRPVPPADRFHAAATRYYAGHPWDALALLGITPDF